MPAAIGARGRPATGHVILKKNESQAPLVCLGIDQRDGRMSNQVWDEFLPADRRISARPNHFKIHILINPSLCFLCCLLLPLPALVAATAPERGFTPGDGPAVPPLEGVLDTLRPGHPRVMAGPQTFDALKAAVARGGLPVQIYSDVRKSADEMLAEAVSKYEIPDGKRLLPTADNSRRSLVTEVKPRGAAGN